MLLDNSIFGSCKAGLILTAENIYFKHLSLHESPNVLALKDIRAVQADEKYEEIYVNGELVIGISMLDDDARENFAIMLRELASQDHDDYAFVAFYAEDVSDASDKGNNFEQEDKEKMKTSATYGWTIFYFITSIVFFATISYFAYTEAYPSEGSPEEGAIEASAVFGVLLAISTIPFFIITFGRKTPRNWKRLLGWIIVEAIYNPFIGVPVWVAWTRKDNKSRYGDEAAFQQEKVEAQARREVAKERNRKIGTTLVALNAANEVYEKMTPEQREKAIQAGLHLGALAALNPDKAKQVKNAVSNLGNPRKSSSANAMERIKELNMLCENQLISKQEYESKKTEILNQI